MSIEVHEDLYDELCGGDGVLGAFFTLLWTKASARRQHVLHGVYIPDTIVYQYSKPIFWYFTAKDGTVKRKLRSRLNCGYIEQQFLSHGKSPSGVVAQYITGRGGHDSTAADITYATRDSLRGFLQGQGRPSCQNGVLQLFFDPKPSSDGTTMHNTVLQATWSPNCFVVDKRINRHRLTNERIPLIRRLTTFDNYADSDGVPMVSSTLRDTLFDVCGRIADHLHALFTYRVASLVLHFKVDANDTPWLLWCSTIRIAQWDNPQRSLTAALQPPANDVARAARAARGTARRRQAERLRRAERAALKGDQPRPCPLCDRTGRGFAQIPRAAALFGLSVLDHFHDAETRGERFNADRTLLSNPPGTLPRCVAMLCGPITPDEYDRVKRDERWRQERVCCCGDCLTTLIRLTQRIHVDADGQIRCPFRAASPRRRPARRVLSAQALRERARREEGAAAGGPPRAASSLQYAAAADGAGGGVHLPPLPALPHATAAGARGAPDDATSSHTHGLSDVPTSVATPHDAEQHERAMHDRLRQCGPRGGGAFAAKRGLPPRGSPAR